MTDPHQNRILYSLLILSLIWAGLDRKLSLSLNKQRVWQTITRDRQTLLISKIYLIC